MQRAAILTHCLQKAIVCKPLMAAVAILLIVFFSGTFLVMVCEDVRSAEATSMTVPAFLGELGRVESRSIITQIGVLVALLSSIAICGPTGGRLVCHRRVGAGRDLTGTRGSWVWISNSARLMPCGT